jgi:para-nitrobenzyl esterase
MQKFSFTLLLALLATGLFAQRGCDGSRYIDAIFTTVDTTSSILYGNGDTYGGANQDLFLDVYEPSGDTETKRPVIILAFGGSFIGGARTDLDNIARYYALRGYVAVTIDYRLYDGPLIPLPNGTTMTDVVVKAVSDMKAAIRFLREDAGNGNTYGIDSTLIFGGGISAGAIVAAHTAFLDSTDTYDADVATAISNNGGFNGNSSSNFQYSSELQGVVNFSGALKSAGYIDANDPPLFSAHDDGDGVVPYAAGNATIFSIPIIAMEGSQVMHTNATNLGLNSSLITIPNSNGHVSYFGSGAATWEDSVRTSSAVFLEQIVCSTPIASLYAVNAPSSKVYPNPSASDITLELGELPSAYQLTLVNAMGQVVYQQSSMMDAFVQIPRQNLPAGMYVLQLQFEDADVPVLQHKLIFR